MRADPAFQMIPDDEARALRLAVIHALQAGLATEWDDKTANNEAMLALGRRIGIDVTPYEGSDDA